MRYPEGHKAEVRERIVTAAAKALRKHGLEGVSIPAVMKKVGLTHGGFYAHFADRDALVAEAVMFAANQTGDRVLAGSPDLGTMLARYLSPEHVAHAEEGCVLAALGTDGPRQHAPVRRAFERAVRGFFDHVERQRLRGKRARPASEDASEPSDATIRLSCQMIGAVMLARLVDDEALSDRILAAAREPERPKH